eukprot:TRINITY_DN14989_c0_g1_i14.p1 TRINITY_DN14989_c0_g1~~TRINITY_DN14989_c0_g1_i14.p1  ORF type:complete len:207 (-),score=17.58 TRINITY_DN14989_c0_g1_i14:219-839(-)
MRLIYRRVVRSTSAAIMKRKLSHDAASQSRAPASTAGVVLYHLRDVSPELMKAAEDGLLEDPYSDLTIVRGNMINRYVIRKQVVDMHDVRSDFLGDVDLDRHYRANGVIMVTDEARETFHGHDPHGAASDRSEDIAARYVLNKDNGNYARYEKNVISMVQKALKNVAEVVVFDHTVRCDSVDDRVRAKVHETTKTLANTFPSERRP